MTAQISLRWRLLTLSPHICEGARSSWRGTSVLRFQDARSE